MVRKGYFFDKTDRKNPLKVNCVMCGKGFKTQKELSEHLFYNCTGGF